MARVATKYVDWKVFIDGIEIPWIAWTVSVGVWNGGAGSFIIEPDKDLQRHLRPTSLVHVFMYDDLEESPNDNDKYKLWWEGEVTGFSHVKSGQNRQLSVDCMGVISYLQKTQMYSLGLGGISNTHILTGSTLIESSGAATNAVRKAIIPRTLSKNEDKTTLGLPGVGDPTINFGERIMNVLAYLLSFNAVGRLNTVRRDLFGKIATITDQSLGRMIPRAVSQPYFEQALAGIQAGGSLLDLIKTLSGSLFYDLVSTTGPVKRVIKFGSLIDFSEYYNLETDALAREQNIYSIPAFKFRNDYFFTPKIYYAMPPACNTIFPEFISNLSLSRTFFDDPTRVVVSTTLGADLSVVAPDSIFRFADRKLSPEEFWSNNVAGINQTGESDSPYVNAGLNLFAAATDIEIERGILCPQVSADFEVFSAVSNLFDLTRSDDISRMQTILKDLGSVPKGAAKVEEFAASKERSYIYALKAIADYQYKLLRFKRDVTLQMDGHRWLVPGLPTTILDMDQSYMALLTNHTFAVDAEANETSTIALNFVRPFPEVNHNLVEKMKEEQGMLAENEKNLQAVEVVAEDRTAMAAKQAENLSTFIEIYEIRRGPSLSGDGPFVGPGGVLYTKKELLDQYKTPASEGVSAIKSNQDYKSLINSSTVIYKLIKSDPLYPDSLKQSLKTTLATVSNEIESPSDDYLNALRAAFSVLSKDIEDYYEVAIKEVQKAAVKLSPALPTVFGAENEKNKLSTSIRNTEFDESEFEEDFFAPPVFANMDFLDLDTTSKIYKELIGSQPLASSTGQPKMANPTVANLKAESYKRFLEFADAMNRIFPVYGTFKESTDWGRRVERADDAQSVRRWEEKTYLRRTGLLSLTDFAREYGLIIKSETSDEPTITPFLTLIPKQFGDSIFDKIVDEFTLKPRDVVVKSGNSSFTRRVESDPAIKKLRNSVKDEMLFARNRQDVILAYSRSHFGSRAFDGR